jgi:hypothetical protein
MAVVVQVTAIQPETVQLLEAEEVFLVVAQDTTEQQLLVKPVTVPRVQVVQAVEQMTEVQLAAQEKLVQCLYGSLNNEKSFT